MKTCLAIVSTPLHLIYLAELAYKHTLDSVEIIILLKRKTDLSHLENVLSEVPHTKVHWITCTRAIQNRFIAIYEAFSIRRLDLNHKYYDYGVFADYGRSMLANINCGRYYWMGDGTKILYETSGKGKKSFNRYKRQKLAEPITLLLFGRRLSLPNEPIIFTPFNLEIENIERNRFEWLRSKYRFSPDDLDLEVVYFFGSYFSERDGKPLMHDKTYLELMKEIARYFEDRDLSLRYVPHRHESTEKLASIERIPGCKVQRFEYPAELEFIKRGRFPAHIASFFSTCLLHFSVMGVCKSITSFYADFSESNPAYGAVAESIYEALEAELGSNSIIQLGTTRGSA